MTRRELQRRARGARWLALLALVAVGVAVGLMIERSYWNGYNDAYNTAQAEYDRGVGDGWRGCVEENNLQDRY